MKLWHAELAWLGRPARDVLIETEGDGIVRVVEGAERRDGTVPLPGLTIPGLANAHSHAFHRALRGRTHEERGTFWSWREQMYAVAEQLDPDRYHRLALATYAEMALAGVTAVGEFHYVHHQPDGSPYPEPNAMGEALMRAAREVGVRLTLIDTCYLQGGFGQPLGGVQKRYSDGDAQRWSDRVAGLREDGLVRVGAGIHSVRAVDPDSMAVVADWAAERDAPLHVHVSEQPAENEACREAFGQSPTELLAGAGVLGPRTTAVHATHVTGADIDLLGSNRTTVCLCPTTERDLADGVGPARALAEAGSALCVGSDSHAVIDLFEEARLIELHQRLVSGRRGHHAAADLFEAASVGGIDALGWRAGRLQPGFLADFVAVDMRSPRLVGSTPERAIEQLVYAGTAVDVTHVVVGGQMIVADRSHVRLGDVGALLADALEGLGT